MKTVELQRITCDQCELLSINGVVCHEHGCPNSKKRFFEGEWRNVLVCSECGEECIEGDCDSACPCIAEFDHN